MWWIPITCYVACIMNSNHRSISSFSHFINCWGPHFFAIRSIYLSRSKQKPPVGITNLVWFSLPNIFLVIWLWLWCCCYIFLSGLVCPLSTWWTSLFPNFTMKISVLTSQPNIILMGDSWPSPRIFLRHSLSALGRGSLYEFGLNNASMISGTALHIGLIPYGNCITNPMISSI